MARRRGPAFARGRMAANGLDLFPEHLSADVRFDPFDPCRRYHDASHRRDVLVHVDCSMGKRLAQQHNWLVEVVPPRFDRTDTLAPLFGEPLRDVVDGVACRSSSRTLAPVAAPPSVRLNAICRCMPSRSPVPSVIRPA